MDKNHAGAHFAFVRAQKFSVDKPVSYRELPDDNCLVVPRGEGDYLTAPIRVGYRASRFRVVEEDDVTMAGFRSYFTADGFFFNDTSILPGYNPIDLINKFRRGQNEETRSTIEASGAIASDLTPHEVIDEPIISLGSDEPSNWGSWLYRILPKLIDCPDRDRLPILATSNAPWMFDLIRLFFGELELRRHAPTKRYKFRKVFVPSLRNIGVYFDSTTIDFYREKAKSFGGTAAYERIYLSRQAQVRKKPGFRTIQNEIQLIQALEERGIKAVEIETLPIIDQIRIMRDAKLIIAPGGSGLFNCVFAKNAELVVDIEPNKTWIYAHHSLLKSSGLDHCIVFGRQPEGAHPHDPWVVDVPSVLAALP